MHHHNHRGLPPQMAARRRRGEFAPEFGFGPFGGPRGGPRGRGRGGRASRGDVRAAILLLLNERPMHGYEIITELGQRTNGVWQPSPGSIYPTLSLLEDEGLVTSNEEDGKRRYSLTPAGSEQIASRGDAAPPWEEITANADPASSGLRESGFQLFAALAQIGRAGSPQQVSEATAILDEARRRLYGLLSESGTTS
jgi:DNA-binding PadR family transcriptional regulator